jgi:Protein of unknown function (DUF2844)
LTAPSFSAIVALWSRCEITMTHDVGPKSTKAALLAATVALLVAIAGPASAALGGDVATVEADAVHLQGRLKIARVQRYAVHEIAAPHGTVVREYVSPAGKVFGVAWNGPVMPDLRQVLGPYFDAYVEAVAKRKARGPVHVAVAGLVVHSSGHMRAFAGSAYLPDGLPAGVAAEEVR